MLQSLITVVLTGASLQGVPWSRILEQPTAWYSSAEARAVADSVLAWQLETGAWPKNIDMTKPPSPGRKPDGRESTIDNGATVTQIRLLARVVEATREDRHSRSAQRGIDYLLKAQYPNGGWPQYFPLRDGYYSHVTFNDGAMAGVVTLLWDVAEARPPFRWVSQDTRAQARAAVDKALELIVRVQVRVDGKRTAWAQQYDEHTLEPRPARTFEPVALASSESVGVVRLLMRVDQPAAHVIEAVECAVAWLRAVRGPDGRWARFYEIGTNRPTFAGRDGVVRYRLDEIERERREGYSWYGSYAAALLDREYPAWEKRTASPR